MRIQSQSVIAPKTVRSIRDDIRANNPRLLTIHDLSPDVFVTHSRSTR